MTRDKDASATAESDNAEAQATPSKPERPPLPGSDVFPAEADDDDPILAGLEEGGTSEEGGGRRRRRRRRRGKGGEGVEANGSGNGNSHGVEAREPRPPREAREPREPREAREPREVREHARDHRDHRDQRGRDFRDRDRDRDRDRGRHEPAIDLNREPGDGDLLGKDLADAAYTVLSRSDRMPASFARVAESLVRHGRLTGAPDALAPTVAAALRADVARASQRGARSRFRIAHQRVSLTEWLLPREALRHEEQASQSAERQREYVRRAFVARLNDLPAAGFAEIIATWLNAEGITSLRAVRRPGSSGREFHFAGTRRRGTEETRLAIVVQRSGRDLDREAVIATRGSLHHYGNASATWLISTSRVTSGAREEAVAEGAAPCALYEGVELAQAMERAGIGIRVHHVPLCDIDLDLLEALGDTGESRARREHEPRERDGRDRDRSRDQDRHERQRGRHDGGGRGSEMAGGQGEREGEAGAQAASEDENELERRDTDIFELREGASEEVAEGEAEGEGSEQGEELDDEGDEGEAQAALDASEDEEHASDDEDEGEGDSDDEPESDEDGDDEDDEDDEDERDR